MPTILPVFDTLRIYAISNRNLLVGFVVGGTGIAYFVMFLVILLNFSEARTCLSNNRLPQIWKARLPLSQMEHFHVVRTVFFFGLETVES